MDRPRFFPATAMSHWKWLISMFLFSKSSGPRFDDGGLIFLMFFFKAPDLVVEIPFFFDVFFWGPQSWFHPCTTWGWSFIYHDLFLEFWWPSKRWLGGWPWDSDEARCRSMKKTSGQIIATSHDLTPKGSWEREIPLFQGNLGWWNIYYLLPGRLCSVRRLVKYNNLARSMSSIAVSCVQPVEVAPYCYTSCLRWGREPGQFYWPKSRRSFVVFHLKWWWWWKAREIWAS